MRRRKDSGRRVKGLGLRARFVLSMSLALTVVMSIAAYTIYVGGNRITESVRTDSIAEAVRFSDEQPQDHPSYTEGREGIRHLNGVYMFPFTYKDDVHGTLFFPRQPEDPDDHDRGLELSVPETDRGAKGQAGLLFAVTAIVILVGACVALWVADRVSRPVAGLIEDVRLIAKGDLTHKTRSVGEGEIELLSRAIDRMTRDLLDAREAELELSIRKREREVAGGVREALLPLATPLVAGYDLGAAFVAAPDFGGDFHDFIEREDGRVGLLVCDVSGTGIPAALVGSTARSYLRGELERTDDLVATMRRVNRWLVGDMRRGMFVSALYALIDPEKGTAQVVCAGHKVPLLRYDAGVGQMRVVHPEGIALGFDRGPVFDRRIQLVETPIEPGDRFVLANSAPLGLKNAAGVELGERNFYARVLKHATLDTSRFLKCVRRDLLGFVGEAGLARDISLVTISREG